MDNINNDYKEIAHDVFEAWSKDTLISSLLMTMENSIINKIEIATLYQILFDFGVLSLSNANVIDATRKAVYESTSVFSEALETIHEDMKALGLNRLIHTYPYMEKVSPDPEPDKEPEEDQPSE